MFDQIQLEQVPSFMTSVDTLGKFDQWRDFLKPLRYNFYVREIHIQNLGFPILTEEAIQYLSQFIGDRKIADLGCGSGYLTAALKKFNVDVHAIDNYQSSYNVDKWHSIDVVDIIHKDMHQMDLNQYHGVVLSWPDYGSDSAFQIASKLSRGQFIIYQGEGSGGCTADDQFHELVNDHSVFENVDVSHINDVHVQFAGIHDMWRIFIKI